MRVLLVSCSLPDKATESSHGVFRRLDMFVAGIRGLVDKLDALFYIHPDIAIQGVDIESLEANLRNRWKMDVHVALCGRVDVAIGPGLWNHFIYPSLGFYNIPNYAEVSGMAQIEAFGNQLARKPDIIFVHRLKSMPPLMLINKPLPPVLLDMDDIEHIAFWRDIRMPPKWRTKFLLNLQIPALLAGEIRAMKMAARTFVCSDMDRKKLSYLPGGKRVMAIPNAVRIPQPYPLTNLPTILIIGQFSYSPNRVGVEYFLDGVWDIILQNNPNARLVVAGPSCDRIRHYQQPPRNVTFPGFVEDLDELYNSSRVVVCPILSGGGTRLKIIEAAAYGKPIVSTMIGAEGLDFINDVHLMIRDEIQAMAEACLRLLMDDNLARGLGEAARAMAIEKYARESIENKITAIFSECLDGRCL